jgi:hypothetical protein
MINSAKRLVKTLVLMLSVGLACCGGGSSPSGGKPGVAGAAGQTSGSAGAAGGGAAGSSTCPTPCDDGYSCTVDSCVGGKCQHTIGPRTGDTACPVGQYCTLESGCVAAPACSTADQCVAAWKDDACKTNIQCEAASSVCTFDLLDKDGDGHAPQICGGDDCNDNDYTISPGAPETCNGIDDNCNGVVDEDHANRGPLGDTLDGPLCSDLMTCQSGQCVCKPENLCGSTCTNISSDADNCGACGQSCGTNSGPSAGWGSWTCVAGTCQCSGDACGTACTSLQSDPKNCGTCGNDCTAVDAKASCQSGKCGRFCVNYMSCSASEICEYHPGYGYECVADPCPGMALSCDAPCNASNQCASCARQGTSTLHCQ